MVKYLLIVISLLTLGLHSQTLNIPARQTTAMNGDQFVTAIIPLSFTNRENLIMQEVLNGNVPSFYRTLSPVTSTATIGGVTKSVTYYVIPDYLAIGCDTNYFLCPMSPIIATKIADSIECTLPTKKMVNDIYAQAALKLTPLSIPASGTMTTVQAFKQHSDMVYAQRSPSVATYPLGTLVGGDKKDVVISNLIYSTANRVIIYGWHTSVGNPIQPLSNVHSDTYMDYSHGMRFVQNAVIYNGSPTTVKAILQSSTLNPLLSDEGVINPPQYPYSNTLSSLATPVSFALINKANNTLEIKVKNDANVTHYKVQTSTNGTSFTAPTSIIKSNLILSSLTPGQICYVKIAAYNSTYSITSSTSEVLAAVPGNYQDSMLIVNGFDRASAGNTYDFVRQHGSSVYADNHYFSSATNEAIQDGLVSLSTYKSADWILGEESTANETFSNSEQTLVSNYLKQGGKLLVSGSEIAWDLDYSGTASDKAFINNYLKASYAADAPNGQASTWYKNVNVSTSSILNLTDTLLFDNGTNGTYNVDYPDVLTPLNGGIATLRYTNNATSNSAIYFSGIFPSGTTAGKSVYFGFPLETVYNISKRNQLFKDVWTFFFNNGVATNLNETATTNYNIFPNPFLNELTIRCKEEIQMIDLFNLNGQLIISKEAHSANESLNLTNISEGIYFLHIKTNSNSFTEKIVKLKN